MGSVLAATSRASLFQRALRLFLPKRLRVTRSLCVRSACLVLEKEWSQPGCENQQAQLIPHRPEGLGGVRSPGPGCSHRGRLMLPSRAGQPSSSLVSYPTKLLLPRAVP